MKYSVNGVLIEADQVSIPLSDRGFLFGEGLFETMRSVKGCVPFLDKHLARMEWSSTFINIPFPHPADIKKEVLRVLKENNLQEARIKIILSCQQGLSLKPVLPNDQLKPNLIVTCEPFESLPDCDYDEGVDLVVLNSIKNDPPPASNMKSLSWLVKMIARRELSEKSAFDGILLNAEGFVTETTTANLFWVVKETLFTAPLSLGLLPGITRHLVMELAKEEGIQLKEGWIKPEALLESNEVFITSSLNEVLPVSRIDGHPIGEETPGKITQQLAKAYSERLAEEVEESLH